MKHPLLRLALATQVALLAALTTPGRAQTIRLTGDVYDGQIGPLGAGVYWCQNIRVPPGRRLTLLNANLKFDDQAALTVDGELSIPFGSYLTSIHDDVIGGDTNGNGGATIPGPGSWFGVRFGAQADDSTLSSTVVRYAGRGGSPGVQVASPTAVVNMPDCVVHDIGGIGIDFGTSAPIATRCILDNCGGPAMAGHFLALSLVFDNFATRCNGNYILRRGTGSAVSTPTVFRLERRHTLNASGVAVLTDWIVVPAGRRLVVDPGLVLKFEATGGLRCQGDLDVLGTPTLPIVLTSIHDDSVGGDTNGNGGATNPAPGGWRNVFCDGQDRTLRMHHTEVRYGGGAFGGALRLANTHLELRASVIRDVLGFGVGFTTGGTSQARHAIVDCTFQNVPQETLSAIPLDSLPACHGNVHGTGTQRQIVIDPLLRTDAAISRANIPDGIAHVPTTIDVGAGRRLTLGAGLAFKFSAGALQTSAGRLEVLGTATAPVVITSVHDDAVGGDTNGNGNATLPQPGQWSGIRLTGSTPSRLEHLRLRYPGTGVQCQSAAARVRAVHVAHPGTLGVFVTALAGHLDDVVVVGGNDRGIQIGGGTFDIRHASVAANAGTGISLAGTWTGAVRNSIAWGNAGGNFVGLAAAQVHSSCGGFAGIQGNLDVDPRFADPDELTLATNSPCLNRGDLVTGALVGTDLAENSRCCDWDYSNQPLPDMGARELTGNELVADIALPRVGDTITFTVTARGASDVGPVVLLLGFLDAEAFLPPYGVVTAGVATLLPLATGATAQPLPLAVPANPFLVGLEFAVQALAIPARLPAQGNLTNRYRARLLPR